MPTTRFAPSPTGNLHLGHAFSALFAKRTAGADGVMLLRIEDIDLTRCRPEFVAAIESDLAWLGFDWPKPVRWQSEHFADYAYALSRLEDLGVLYPCFCTRADLAQFAAATHENSGIYPGICRVLSDDERQARIGTGQAYALRLDVAAALRLVERPRWRDLDTGWLDAQPELLGDVILARKDIQASYHVAVVWDDALQAVDIVTRGEDLFDATHVHRLLQSLLALPVPVWRHHRLLKNAAGKRFAKRDQAPTLRAMRETGQTRAQILELINS